MPEFLSAKMILKIFLLLMLSVELGNTDDPSAGSNTQDYYDSLKRDMLSHGRIDTKKRPVSHYQDAVEVTSTLVILHIYKLDEVTGTLVVNGWLEAYWMDPQLAWNPSNYGGIDYIELADMEVWKPDLTVINSAENAVPEFNKGIVYVGYTGHIAWMPSFVSRTSCIIDHKYFPFDEHVCTIDVGSWNYDNRSLTLRNPYTRHPESEALSAIRTENPLWKIVDDSVTTVNMSLDCCPQFVYPYIQHTLRLRRNSPLYKFLLIIPSIMSVMLTLALFWTPPSAGEKITLGGISVVIQLGLLIALGFIVPPGGINVPHIVLFVGNSFVMSCLALCISILVIRLSRGHSYTPVPSSIKNILNGPLGRILCFGQTSHQGDTAILNEEKPESESAEGTVPSEQERPSAIYKPSTFGDWIFLATAIDHLCFIIYSIIFALILIASFA